MESFFITFNKGNIQDKSPYEWIVYCSVCHILWAASHGFQVKTGREFFCEVASNRSVVSADMVREETIAALGLGHAVLIKQNFHLILRFCGHDFLCENNRTCYPFCSLVSVLTMKFTIILSLCFIHICQYIFYVMDTLHVENEIGKAYSKIKNVRRQFLILLLFLICWV